MAERTTVLNSLIQFDRPIEQICADLGTFPWDCPHELVTLAAEHIRNVLARLSSGDLTPDAVYEWANAVEMREDIAYEERCHEEIVEALFVLAFPLLNGPLDADEIARLVASLSNRAEVTPEIAGSTGPQMHDDVKFHTLEEALSQLPPGTPFFIPDEMLAHFFPPWASLGELDPESLDAAKRFGERFGCTVTYDSFMGHWCFTKPKHPN